MNKNNKKIIAVVLARMSASRLPGKVMKEILGVPILKILIERIKDSRLLSGMVVATSINKEDDIIEEFCKKNDINVFRGSEKDVLERIYFTAKKYDAEVIVEQGADCPLVDSELIDSALEFYFNNDFDYVTTLHNKRSAPHGYFLRICPVNLLEEVYNDTNASTYNREDTLFYIESHPELYRIGNFIPNKETHAKDFRLTIDHPKDFELMKLILKHFSSIKVPMKNIVKYLKENPKLALINKTEHHTEYKLFKIGIFGDYNINDPLLKNLSQYKDVDGHLTTNFKFVAFAGDNTKEFQDKFRIKRTYKNYSEMLENENLDVLITSLINTSIIQKAVNNKIKIIINNDLSDEIINLCKDNNIILMSKNSDIKKIVYELRK